MKNIKIIVFDCFSLKLERIWREFEKNTLDSPFQSFAWLNHWQNSIGSPLYLMKPQIIVISNKEKVVAIFPMGINKSYGVLKLEWIGGVNSDYMGPILGKQWGELTGDFQSYWNNAVKKMDLFDIIHLQKQKKYIGMFPNPFISFEKFQNNVMSYQVEFNCEWKKHYEINISKKLRADSSRQKRRLAEIGKLKFVIADTIASKINIVNIMMRQKSRRYRDTNKWDMLAISEYKKFYKGLTEMNDQSLNIHYSELRIKDTVLATHVGLVDQTTFYYLMPANEVGIWKKYSPGRILLEFIQEWSTQNGLKVFDFTVGGEAYKKQWCNAETPLYETLIASTFKGKIYLIISNLKNSIKQVPWLENKAKSFYTWLRNKKKYHFIK